MPRVLPARPDLDQLKHQAKSLSKAHRRNDADACTVLRNLRRFAAASDADILAADIRLHEAQYALALEYGFPSWYALRMHVLAQTRIPLTATLRRDGERVWLDGVKGWHVGEKQISVHAAMEAVLRAAGEEISYEYLVGVSGLAFRLQVSFDGLCPSSPHPACGFQCLELARAASPRQLESLNAYQVEGAEKQAVLDKVKASIDRGIAVQYGAEEDGVVVGYQQDAELLCLHPYKDHETPFVETEWPWSFYLYTEKKAEAPDRHALPIASLRQAVAMARRPSHEGYWLGFRAWEEFIDKVKALNQADRGNAWIFECLCANRKTAAAYLREIAEDFPPEIASHLLIAADRYEQMVACALCADGRSSVEIAPYPWMLKDGETWGDEARRAQIQRLQAAYPLERQAIAELEKAVTLIER